MTRDLEITRIKKDWSDHPRWKGVQRPYCAEDVYRLRGTLAIEYTLARRGAEKLWQRLRARAGRPPQLRRAAERLSDLLARADFVPPYELYAEILGAQGGRRMLLERLAATAFRRRGHKRDRRAYPRRRRRGGPSAPSRA